MKKGIFGVNKNNLDSQDVIFVIEYRFPFGTTNVPPRKIVNSVSAILTWNAPEMT